MTIHAPVPDFAAARAAMVESQLRPQGVTDRGVLAAMGSLPREQFVPPEVRPLAYFDRSLALGSGRFMAPPAVTGRLLTEMAPAAGQRALVVGAGTGFSAAVLEHVGLDVVALESEPALAAEARAAGLTVAEGPLNDGFAKGAPYDLILVDGGIEFIPDALVGQLAEGGRLGAPLSDRGVTRLVVGRKSAGAFGFLSIGDAGVAPLPGFSRPREFTF